MVRVDNSTITIDADGVLEAQIPQALNFKGSLNITSTNGGPDSEPATPNAGDTYTSVPGGTIASPWGGGSALIDGWSSGDKTSTGDLIICNADGGGAGNWVLVPTGGNEVWVDSGSGYVYPADTSNEVRVPQLADGNEGTTGTDLAMLDDNGQFVRSAPGNGLSISSGQLGVTFPAGLWTDDSGTLHPSTLGSNVEIRDSSDNAVITFNDDGTAEFTSDVTLSGDGFLKLPVGTDLERPGTPAAGMVRYTNQNTEPPVAAGAQQGYIDLTTSTTEPSTTAGHTYTISATGTMTSGGKALFLVAPQLVLRGIMSSARWLEAAPMAGVM